MNEGHLSRFLSLVKTVGMSSVSSSVCPVLVTVVQTIVPLFSQGSLYFNGIWQHSTGALFEWALYPFLLSPPFNRSAFFYQVFRSQLSISSVSDQDACRAGLQPVSRWKAYGLSGYPGRCPWFQEKWLQPCFFWFRHPPFYLSCPIWKIYFGLPQRNLMFVMLVCWFVLLVVVLLACFLLSAGGQTHQLKDEMQWYMEIRTEEPVVSWHLNQTDHPLWERIRIAIAFDRNVILLQHQFLLNIHRKR